MREPGVDPCRSYHHGDLRRGLVEAALRILEADGSTALSLRAVAREAGVSAAAPYYHFADKTELVCAVAKQGWAQLDERMAQAVPDARDTLIELGVAYVSFAREHPALYRVMYDSARDTKSLAPAMAHGEESGYARVRNAIRLALGEPASPAQLELTAIAAWCAAHGLAEMVGFRQFDGVKAAVGGEPAFVRAVLARLKASPAAAPYDAAGDRPDGG